MIEPTNSSKRFPYLTQTIELFKEQKTISVDSLIDFYLTYYPCGENRQSISMEITKIVNFNSTVSLYICTTGELKLLCIRFD